MSTPQTTIYLCSGVRLNSRYEHSIYFPSKSAQERYFGGKVAKTLPAYSFVRRSWTLKIEADFTDAVKWNYLYFRYPNDSKFYYYFINKVEYINDSTTELTLELDLIQTYLFDDVELLECMIEREHVADDSIGLHTVDEGLETGDYQDTNEQRIADTYTDGDAILLLATFNPMTTTSANNAVTTGGVYNGIYSGLGLYAIDIKDADTLTNALDSFSAMNLIDGIVTMWMYPKEMIRLQGEQTWDGDQNLWCKNVDGIYSTDAFNYVSNLFIEGRPGANNYTPKNNKVLCYPYNFLYVSNNAGGHADYKFERFNAHDLATFELMGGLSPDSSVRLIPRHYNGVSATSKLSNDYGLTLGAYPTCAWNADAYKIWLAQHGQQNDLQKTSANVTAAGGALSVGLAIAGLLTGGVGALAGAGVIAGGASTMFGGAMKAKSAIAEEKVAASQPDQARGSYSPNINAANGLQFFTAIQKQITVERAKIIDDYFTMYGYKVTRLGVPSLKNRKYFTYVKTIGCHAVGNVTNEDISKIESIFDKGITFWTSDAVIGDYTVNNSTS